jgi:hypothetical protein
LRKRRAGHAVVVEVDGSGTQTTDRWDISTFGALKRRPFASIAVAFVVFSCVQAPQKTESLNPSLNPSPEPAAAVLTQTAAPPPTAQTAPPAGGTTPASAGSVADAGVLYVIGADDGIYRYDGRSGQLTPVWRASSFDSVGAAGVYAAGRHGGLTLLRWDGTTVDAGCGVGYGTVSSTGSCASYGPDGIAVRLAGEAAPRLVLPPDWHGASAVWSPDGDRLLLVRMIEPRPGPGMDPGLSALWVLEKDGHTREVYRPPARGVLTTPRWSPDGRFAVIRQYTTTSNSFAADGVGTSLLLIEVATGHVVDLGIVMSAPQWGPRGELAYVSGGGRMTWENKTLFVRGADGRERVAQTPTSEPRVALAPAWDAGGRLAWISGPALPGSGNGDGYIDGAGAGQRIVVIGDGANTSEVRCGAGRVAEGVRWSNDGDALLVLCRKPGRDPFPLELWLHRMSDGTSAPLVTGLVGGPPEAAGFGVYGAQPSLFSIVAWSHAAN